MTHRNRFIFGLTVSAASVLIFVSNAAQAGFEWLPGPAAAKPAPAAPIDPVLPSPQDALPTMNEGLATPPPVTQTEILAVPTTPPQIEETLVEGFGEDIPLALALQQLAPDNFAFSFAPAVNPGVRVSWTSGKTWTQTIQDMLAPLNLNARFGDRLVHISNTSTAIEQHTSLEMPRTESVNLEQELNASAKNNISESEVVPVIKRLQITDPGETAQQAKAENLPEAAPPAIMADAESNMVKTEGSMPASDKAEVASASPAFDNSEIINLLPPPAEETEIVSLLDSMQPASGNIETPSETVHFWQAEQGQSLRETLESWSEQADIELVWQAAHDYRVDHDVMLSDTFQNAIKTMVTEGLAPENRPAMRFSPADGAPSLIVQDGPGKQSGKS
jgi:hypothetical protein